MMLPPGLARTVDEQGWGEQHPVARMGPVPQTALMVYGPRDEDELDIIWKLLRASHTFATGTAAERRTSNPAAP